MRCLFNSKSKLTSNSQEDTFPLAQTLASTSMMSASLDMILTDYKQRIYT